MRVGAVAVQGSPYSAGTGHASRQDRRPKLALLAAGLRARTQAGEGGHGPKLDSKPVPPFLLLLLALTK